MSQEAVIISTLNQLLEELAEIKENLYLSKKVFNVQDFSRYSGFKESYIYKIIGRKEVDHSKPGGKMVFFNKDKIDEYLLSNEFKSADTIQNEAIEFALTRK